MPASPVIAADAERGDREVAPQHVVGVGALLRNQIVTVTALLLLGFAIEPLLLAVVPEVVRFGPTLGAPSAILGTDLPGVSLLAPGIGVAVSIAWASAAFAAGAAFLRGRDLV